MKNIMEHDSIIFPCLICAAVNCPASEGIMFLRLSHALEQTQLKAEWFKTSCNAGPNALPTPGKQLK